ncbi:hypothetical protein [Dehalobacter restrictus]|uniref:hypothetical protein n=1 Tax=Dehalobacter restrictus TaxID=55583 RepID=UPI00338E4861
MGVTFISGVAPIVFIAGEHLFASNDAVKMLSNDNAPMRAKEITVGTSKKVQAVRTSFDLRQYNGQDGGYSVYGQIYKNGVAVGMMRSQTSTLYITYTEDIPCQSGDLIQIYLWRTVNGNWAECRNFRLYTIPNIGFPVASNTMV